MGVIVRQKQKGRGQPWWVFVCHQGNRISKCVGDKKSAESVASEIRIQLKTGELNLGNRAAAIPLFKDFAQGFLDTYSKLNHKPSTQESYNYILDTHILPALGEMPIDQITRKNVKDLLVEKQTSGLAANTVRLILAYLSAILNEALDDELILANPAVRTQKVIAKGQKKEISPLTVDELAHFLATVEANYSKDYTLCLLLARTGMRIGEARALEWGDIDFNGRFIEVRRSVDPAARRVETPKSGKSRRVDMSPQLTEVLKLHQRQTIKKGLALGIGQIDLVFSNQNGGYSDLSNWRNQVFNKAIKKAKMQTFRIHDLRHTYATLRIAAGHNIADVSKQIGHSSVKLTLDIYYHWMPGQNKSEVDSLDDLHVSSIPPTPHPHPEAVHQ